MKTRLRNTVSPADLDELKDVHRRLQKLLVGLNPAADCHAPLWAAMVKVRACGVELSHDLGWGSVRDGKFGQPQRGADPSKQSA